MTSKNALAVKSYELGDVKQVTAMAVVLKQHIVQHQLYTSISDKNYVHVEGWQFAGGLLGLFPIVRSIENIGSVNEFKWKAEAEIIDLNGKVVGRGFAICSNKEGRKKSFDEYAVLSMAQTRSIGKAYRNLIGWVMKLAGYESTPEEEMRNIGEEKKPKAEKKDEADQSIVLKPGQVEGPDGAPVYVCAADGEIISEQVASYSIRLYKKPLCKKHQKEVQK